MAGLGELTGSYIVGGTRRFAVLLAEAFAREMGAPLCRGEPGCCGVHVGAVPPKECRPLLVVLVDGNRLRRFGLRRVEARRVGPGIYLLRGAGVRLYLREDGDTVRVIEPPCPRGLLEELHGLLGEEAPLRDAVDALAAAIGGSRGEAREVLMSLVSRGCLELVGGGKRVRIPGP